MSLDKVIFVVCLYTVTYWSARETTPKAGKCREAIGGEDDLVAHVLFRVQNLAQGCVSDDRGL